MPVNTVSRIIGEDDNKLWRMVRYHIMKILGKAVDDVRKEEIKEQDILRGTKYLWLKNRENFTVTQEETLKAIESMPHRNLKTVRALHIRENFQYIYKEPTCPNPLIVLRTSKFFLTRSHKDTEILFILLCAFVPLYDYFLRTSYKALRCTIFDIRSPAPGSWLPIPRSKSRRNLGAIRTHRSNLPFCLIPLFPPYASRLLFRHLTPGL